jgi:phage shock protein A
MLDKSANPEADLNLFMLDMQKGIKQVEEEIYNSVARQKMLEINATEARRKAQEWDAKAQMAVKAGRDDLATEALRLKLSAEQEAEAAEKQASDQKATTTQMRAQLEELKKKYAETDQNKGNLIAQYNMAKYGQKVMGVRNPVTGMPESDYSRMEQKVLAQEARAAMDQDTLRAAAAEAELNNMQTEATLEDELAALKQRMGANKPKTEAPKADNDKPYDEK